MRSTATVIIALIILGVSNILTQAFAVELSIKTIQAIADGTKKELNVPIKLDDETILFDILSSTSRIIYKYTLIKYNANQIIPNTFNENMRPDLLQNYCENADMIFFRDNNISADYIYSGADNKVISSILVSPVDCK